MGTKAADRKASLVDSVSLRHESCLMMVYKAANALRRLVFECEVGLQGRKPTVTTMQSWNKPPQVLIVSFHQTCDARCNYTTNGHGKFAWKITTVKSLPSQARRSDPSEC